MQDGQMLEKMKKFSNIMIKVGTGGAFVLTLGLVGLYHLQEKLIYHPVIPGLSKYNEDNPPGYKNPSERGLSYKDIEILTSDKVKIRGWFVEQKQNSDKCPTVLFFHENAGNIGTRLDFVKYYHDLVGVNVLIMAYRGFSNSDSAKINEKGIKRDVEAIMKFIFEKQELQIDRNLIFTHGRSLGGATSLYANIFLQQSLQNYQVKGAIFENTFTSITDVGKSILPAAIMKFAPLIIRNNWESSKIIGEIKSRSLFIQSLQDELVPPEQMKQLYDMAKCQKELYVMPNGDHNNNWGRDPYGYFQRIKDFIYSNQGEIKL